MFTGWQMYIAKVSSRGERGNKAGPLYQPDSHYWMKLCCWDFVGTVYMHKLI